MQMRSLEQLAPYTHTVLYWRHKEHFLMDTDTHHTWMMFAVESGSFRFEIGEAAGIAKRGDLVFCPPFVPFRRRVLEPLTFFAFTFTLGIGEAGGISAAAYSADPDGQNAGEAYVETAVDVGDGPVGTDVAREAVSDRTDRPRPGGMSGITADAWHDESWRSLCPVGKAAIADWHRLSSDFDYLRACWKLDGAPFIERRRYLLQDIWRLYVWERDSAHRTASVHADPLMEQAERFIRETAADDVSMRDIAARLALSPVQLTRRYTAAYGQTPASYRTAIRMQQAVALLVETDLTLDDIARRCGFDNGFYFSRAFSAKMGMPPSRYRAAYRL